MKLSFRHGIVRYQTDSNNNPVFLQKAVSGEYITLYVSPDKTLITISHNEQDYLFEESQTVNNAWGPFTVGVDYWLYWDIDILTGMRSFNYTLIEPQIGFTPPINPQSDQHWYDKATNVMKYWNGVRWIDCLRVFACRYTQGSVINAYTIGSQVGTTGDDFYSGFILYDDNQKPLRKSQLDGRGKFLTTESKFYTQSSSIINVSIEAQTKIAKAIDNIPAFHLVAYKGHDEIGVASSNEPAYPAIGIVREDLYAMEVGSFANSGYITNIDWNFTEPASTPIYLGLYGAVVTDAPNTGFIQPIGYIVSSDTIYLSISNPFIYSDLNTVNQPLPLMVDRITGRFLISQNATSAPGYGESTLGYMFDGTQLTGMASQVWNINHQLNSRKIVCQTYDENYNQVFPDNIIIIDNNNVSIVWNVQQLGYAHIILF